jgi:hypothetical protein
MARMTSLQERVMQRRNTAAFIRQDPTVINIRRKRLETNVRGGQSEVGEPKKREAKVHLTKSGPSGDNSGFTEVGRTQYVKDQLVGMYDIDIEVGDIFDVAEHTYCVEFISPDRSYETRATLKLYESD